jgi:penicillin-binding protein 1B
MKKAAALPQYSNMKDFSQPAGVVDVQLDKVTNRLATSNCPDDYVSAFVAGTEPRDTCEEQSGMKGFFSKLFGTSSAPVMPQVQPTSTQNPNNQDDPKKKKGFLGKIAGIFKDDKSSTTSKPPDTPQPAPH